MATAHSDKEALKQAIKEALAETLHEHKDLLREALAEALEDLALAEAIGEGRDTKEVRREEVFRLLRSKE